MTTWCVQHCGNAWTSMKGRVIFWIQFNTEQQTGIVYFKLFGQQCQKCMPGTFEHSMWYPEEVVKVRQNSCVINPFTPNVAIWVQL